MNRNRLVSVLSGCLLTMGSALGQETPGFVLDGHVPGLEDGTTVRLVNLEKDGSRGEPLGETTARDGRFTFRGSVVSPTLCRVEILRTETYEDGSSYETETDTRLMLENVHVAMEAVHLDSLPLTYEFGHSPLEKERNATVTGGRAQQEYLAYRKALHAAELVAWQMERRYVDLQFSRQKKEHADSLSYYKQRSQEAAGKVKALTDAFIRSHPEASVSVYLVGRKLTEPFSLTADELDRWLDCVKGTCDTVRLAHVRQQAEAYRAYVVGQPLKDFALLDTGRQPTTLAAVRKPGVYTLVDFWASWCGPCRASIPHLKQLYEAQPVALDIISVSVDRKEADWQRAMKEEQMPWRQFTVTPEVSKQLSELYQLTGIPFLLLLDPDGNIRVGTHSPDVVERMLMQEASEETAL